VARFSRRIRSAHSRSTLGGPRYGLNSGLDPPALRQAEHFPSEPIPYRLQQHVRQV
jgi:hypothetical protein